MTNIVSGTSQGTTAAEKALEGPEVLRSRAFSLRYMPLVYRLKEAGITGIIGAESVTHMLTVSDELDQTQIQEDLEAMMFAIHKASQDPRNIDLVDIRIRAAWIEAGQAELVQILRQLDFFSLCVVEDPDLTRTTIMVKNFT
jgi:hypothetical protein